MPSQLWTSHRCEKEKFGGERKRNHINHYNKNKQDSAKRNQCFVFQSFQTIITPDLKGTPQCNNKSAPLELLDTARSLVCVTAVDACKTATRACFAYHLTMNPITRVQTKELYPQCCHRTAALTSKWVHSLWHTLMVCSVSALASFPSLV